MANTNLFTLLTCALACLLSTPSASTAETVKNAEVLITIDPVARYQVMEGFGQGGMDQMIPFWYKKFPQETREQILDTLYTLKDNGLGLNICRFLMPVGDNPGHKHMGRLSGDANRAFEPEDGVFQWHGHENILWHGQGAQKRGAKMWANWYSVPYWLTVSGCTAGSKDGTSDNLIAGKEERFIKHVCNVLKHFKESWAVDFDYLSVINEPEADWWKAGGGQPGCHVSPEQAIKLTKILDRKLNEYEFDYQIVAYDAAYTNTSSYLKQMLNSEAEKNIDVISCHQYHTSPQALKEWNKLAVKYNKSLWMSEWGDWQNAGYPHDKPLEQSVNYANKIHEALTALKVNAWVIWEPGFLFDAKDKSLVPRKAYWTVAQYSRHIRPGMTQIGSAASSDSCKTTVWVDQNKKTLVVVSFNSSNEAINAIYNTSAFDDISVDKIFLTSPTDNYKQISKGTAESNCFKISIPARSTITLLFQSH